MPVYRCQWPGLPIGRIDSYWLKIANIINLIEWIISVIGRAVPVT